MTKNSTENWLTALRDFRSVLDASVGERSFITGRGLGNEDWGLNFFPRQKRGMKFFPPFQEGLEFAVFFLLIGSWQ